jgi:hypothetical protein
MSSPNSTYRYVPIIFPTCELRIRGFYAVAQNSHCRVQVTRSEKGLPTIYSIRMDLNTTLHYCAYLFSS